MSAVRPSAVIGASRWLAANRLDGASTNSATAKATKRFRFFIFFLVFLARTKSVDVAKAIFSAGDVASRSQQPRMASTYCSMYVREGGSDWSIVGKVPGCVANLSVRSTHS